MALAQKTIAPPPAAAPATASVAVEENGAPPAADSGDFLGGLPLMLLMFVPLIGVMFWSSRSQQKKQQKMLTEIKKGDSVLLQSGIRGKLLELGDRFAKVEIAPGTKVEVLRTSLLGKDSADTAAQLEKR